MQKRFLETGNIVSTHGIQGQVRVQPWCDEAEFLTEFEFFFLDINGRERINVESSFVNKNVVVMKLEGIDSIEQAQLLRNRIIYIDRDEIELPEDTWFIQDLIGLIVKDTDTGHEYGKISNISQTGANDIYHVTNNDKEYLIPAIPDVVLNTDIEQGIIEIRPLKGLFDI